MHKLRRCVFKFSSNSKSSDLLSGRPSGSSSIITSSSAKELKRLSHSFLNPPQYEDSLKAYEDYLVKLKSKSSISVLLYADELVKLRKRNARFERHLTNVSISFAGIFLAIVAYLLNLIIRSRFKNSEGGSDLKTLLTTLKLKLSSKTGKLVLLSPPEIARLSQNIHNQVDVLDYLIGQQELNPEYRQAFFSLISAIEVISDVRLLTLIKRIQSSGVGLSFAERETLFSFLERLEPGGFNREILMSECLLMIYSDLSTQQKHIASSILGAWHKKPLDEATETAGLVFSGRLREFRKHQILQIRGKVASLVEGT